MRALLHELAHRGQQSIERLRSLTMRKDDIVNWLGREHGYRSYLEVATYTTGARFAHVDRSVFSTIRRMMYNLPASYDDDLEIHYRDAGQDSRGLFRQAGQDGLSFDVIFVDSYHGYEASRLDLEQALDLLAPAGTLVAHDCNPPSKRLATPEFRPGGWCGLSYAAFIDVVYARDDLEFCVVDTDYGCGVVRRAADLTPAITTTSNARALRERHLQEEVRQRRRHLEWAFFDHHRVELLHLIPPRTFKRLFARTQPPARPRTPNRDSVRPGRDGLF